jgi:hypothetical protein
MPSKPLRSWLYTLGVLLSVGGIALRINHLISLGICFALLTMGMLLVSKARKIRKTQSE